MIGGILILAIAIFGILVLFGRADASRFYYFAIFLIVVPIVLSIGVSHTLWFLSGLPWWFQVVTLAATPFLVMAIIRSLITNKKGFDTVLSILFETLVYAVTFPIRLVWRAFRLIFIRERHTIDLADRRPVVGGRPPFALEEREGRLRRR